MIEKKKEIGGYFGFEKLIDNTYHKGAIPLNLGRNALAYLLKAKKIRKIYLPYLLCDSVSNLCKRESVEYSFYNIDDKFQPIFNIRLGENEYLYIVNYYGQLSNKRIELLKKRYKRIIIDNTHAFFQKPVDGVDSIYSCRKFFGVPDGAYLYTDKELYIDIPEDFSKDRMEHILGRFEKSASEYYAAFKKNDDQFEMLELRRMSKLTKNIMGAIAYEDVILKRNENFKILMKELGPYNRLDINKIEAAYCYPFYCESGMEIKKKLADNNVYIATLWPNVIQLKQKLECDYAENILPLPCDQRYGANDMIKVVELISEYCKINI